MTQPLPRPARTPRPVRTSRPALAPLALAALLAGLAAPALAGRPLQTEDAGVLAAGAWELEGAWGRAKAGGISARAATVQLGRGFGPAQAALLLGRASAAGAGADMAAFVGKARLWESGDAGLVLAWGLGWGRDRSAGGGWQHDTSELRLVYSRPVGAGLTLHANLARSRDERAQQHSNGWNLALEHEGFALAGVHTAAMAEVFGDNRGERWWNAGLRFTLAADSAWLDTSYGRRFSGGDDRLFTLGFKLAF